MSNFTDVGKFLTKFGLDNANARVGPRPELPRELIDFRLRFLKEELEELTIAYAQNDTAGVADALVDLAYVALGTAHLHGFPWEMLFYEVHASNMKKVRATRVEDSARGSVYDIVKPRGWQKPDIAGVLKQHGWKFPCAEIGCVAYQTVDGVYCTVHGG